MKHYLICIGLCLPMFSGFGQQLILSGYAHEYPSDHQLGDQFTTVITNSSDEQLCLFARLDGLGDDAQYIFWSDSARDAWIMSQVDEFAPIEQQVMQAVSAIEQVLKSPFFKNRHLIFSAYSSVSQSSKKYSWVGVGHSIYNYQCGDYSYLLIRALESLGLSTWDNLRLNSLGVMISGEYVGRHAVAEVFSGGGWIKVDPDPGTPRTQETNPANLNGFASVADIIENPGIVEDVLYQWISESGDSIVLTNQTLAEYRQTFEESHPYELSNEDMETYPVSSTIKIPPGATMSTYYQEASLLIDMSGYSVSYIDSITAEYLTLYQLGDIDGIVSILVAHTGLPEGVVHDAVMEGRVVPTPIPYWPGYDKRAFVPYVTLHVPPSPDTVFLGTDLSAPFLVRKVDLPQGGAMYLDDEFIVNNTREYFLFDTVYTADRTAPVVSDNDVHYLTEGYILPHTEAIFTCYYNPRYYDFWNGITFDVLCGEMPEVSQDFTYGPYHMTTNMNEVIQGEFQVLYPNPVSAGAEMGQLKDSIMTDMQGNRILVSNHAPLVPGMYLVHRDSEKGVTVSKLLVVP